MIQLAQYKSSDKTCKDGKWHPRIQELSVYRYAILYSRVFLRKSVLS